MSWNSKEHPEWMKDWDWQEAFKCASEMSECPPKPGKPGVLEIDDVAEVISADDGCNDGDNWVMVGKLKSGRFFFMTAWCDYTGWDCQAGGSSYVCDDLETLKTLALTKEDMDRLF